jgi:hypothetical protein
MTVHTSPAWRKSSFSELSCVETAALDTGVVAMRNSNHPTTGTLLVSAGQMGVFVEGIKAGYLDELTV